MKVIKDSVHISGMTCIMCQNTIESALNSTNGIINAKVDYKKEKAQVEYDCDIVSITDIINVIKEKGYEVKSASVRFVVAWKPKEAPKDEPETAVLLADLLLSR